MLYDRLYTTLLKEIKANYWKLASHHFKVPYK